LKGAEEERDYYISLMLELEGTAKERDYYKAQFQRAYPQEDVRDSDMNPDHQVEANNQVFLESIISRIRQFCLERIVLVSFFNWSASARLDKVHFAHPLI